MKQYVVDELRPDDYQKVKEYLDRTVTAGSIDGIYWIPLQKDLLTPEQAAHADCHPLCVAVDLEPDRLNCELMVRTRNRVRCSCIGYATEKQCRWIIRYVDAVFERLDIQT